MAIFAQYVPPKTQPGTKTINFNAANGDEYDRMFSELKDLANRYEPGFRQPDFKVKEICEVILYRGSEIICERSWREWKKRVGVTVTGTGTHDAGSYFALQLVAKFKKEKGNRTPMTKKALLAFAKRQKAQVSAIFTDDPNYEFSGRLFSDIAYHLTGHRLSQTYLYEIFRSRLNLQFRRNNVYTVKEASALLKRMGYTLLKEEKEQQIQAQKILDAIYKDA